MARANLFRMTDEDARLMLEGIRWPSGPVCPKCGSTRVGTMNGKSCRPGLKQCKDCRKQFTVTVGTIFESSHIGLSDWMFAVASMCASKKGISALQLKRQLGVSYETAWFMCHRIREAMRSEGGLLSGNLEADETYVGGKPRNRSNYKRWQAETLKVGRGTDKTPVFVLVERDGNARTRVLPDVTARTLRSAIQESADMTSTLHTDEFTVYKGIGKDFEGGHKIVTHSLGEYTSAEGGSTNTAESYFSLIKRGVYGNFHNVSKKHLHRYMIEFEFRWNNRKVDDGARTVRALKQAEGKRLMYKGSTGNATI